MYINQFWMGVAATIFAMCLAFVITAIVETAKRRSRARKISKELQGSIDKVKEAMKTKK